MGSNDRAGYFGNKADYVVMDLGDGIWTVTDTNLGNGNDGTDTLTGIEWLQFNDGQEALGVVPGINGTAGDDTLSGTGGNDTLNGLNGNDQLNGGEGNDLQAGGNDQDDLHGGNGNDTLLGGSGNDHLSGEGGNDFLDGGADYDNVDYSSASSAVTINLAIVGPQDTGGAGIDALLNIEQVDGSQFNDLLIGNAEWNSLVGNAGNDTLDGAGGNDQAGYWTASAAVTVNLSIVGPQNTGGAGTDTLLNIEELRGSYFNDHLTGNAGDNFIHGDYGDDTIDGAGGIDTATYWGGGTAVTVNLAISGPQNTGEYGTDTLINIENLTSRRCLLISSAATRVTTVSMASAATIP